MIDALEHLWDAEQIGDTAGIEAGHAEFKAADESFGGNVDKHGSVIGANQVSDEQRQAYEAWKATPEGIQLWGNLPKR